MCNTSPDAIITATNRCHYDSNYYNNTQHPNITQKHAESNNRRTTLHQHIPTLHQHRLRQHQHHYCTTTVPPKPTPLLYYHRPAKANTTTVLPPSRQNQHRPANDGYDDKHRIGTYFQDGVTNYLSEDFTGVECGCNGRTTVVDVDAESSSGGGTGSTTIAIVVLAALAVLAVVVCGCFIRVKRRKAVRKDVDDAEPKENVAAAAAFS